MVLTQASIDQLKRHLAEGEFADAKDMNTLKQLIDYEVNIRRKQGYTLTKEIAVINKQFDTAKYINNLIGGLRKIHKEKFQLVTQNITFIKALFDLVTKIEKLMTYKDQTKYGDNAGCDGECRGLCSGCEGSCTGNNNCAFVAAGGGGTICVFSDAGVCNSYQMVFKYDSGNGSITYFILDSSGTYHEIDSKGRKTGVSLPSSTKTPFQSTTIKEALDPRWNKANASSSLLAKSIADAFKKNPTLAGILTGIRNYAGCTQNGCGGNYGGSGCNQTASGWDYNATTSSGCAFNGACGGKNYSH